MLPETLDRYNQERAEQLLLVFERYLEQEGVSSKISTYTHRTYALLQDLYCWLNIRLEWEENPESQGVIMLLDAQEQLAKQILGVYEEDCDPMEKMASILAFLSMVDDFELRMMPGFLWEQLVEFVRQGLIPPEFAQRILCLKR